MPSANPKGILASSPRLRDTSYLGLRFRNEFNRNAVVANPSTVTIQSHTYFFIPFDLVSFQQRAQLVLETNLAMMLLLSRVYCFTGSRFDWLTEKSA